MGTMRVLVVDDEGDFRETMVSRLLKRNIDASGAENGEKALKLINKFTYDVVILDIRMNGIDGIAVLREIKKIKPLIEVVLLTGHGTVESGIEGMKLGAYDYILKPAKFDDIFEKIQNAYEKKCVRSEKIRQAFIRDSNAHPACVPKIL
jgi:DNA-binding NtrC family response regulator